MPQVGEVVAGKYRIDAVIGAGGMGAVFAATHLLTSKRVALKWMLPELASDAGALQRFLREAQAAGRIDHPNVVNVHDVGEHEGSTFLVMEFLYGETMTEAMARGDLDARQVIELLLPAMRGVAAAHKMGVVHRDLKPDNIFLCRGADGSYREPKVLDFGISKVSSSDGQVSPRLTRTGAIMGTPYYMSPEQVRGSDEVDRRTDVYAFGVILYEALTGHVPFDAISYGALIVAIVTGTPKRPRELRPELPAELEAVVMRAMAREQVDRFPDVESLALALEPFATGLTFRVDRPETGSLRRAATGTTPFATEGVAEVPKKKPTVPIAIAAAALLLGAAVWALFASSSKPDAEPVHTVQPAAASAVAPPPTVAAPALNVPQAAEVPEAAPGSPLLPKTELPRTRGAEPAPLVAPAAAGTAASGVAVPGSRNAQRADQLPTHEAPMRRGSGRTGGLKSDEF